MSASVIDFYTRKAAPLAAPPAFDHGEVLGEGMAILALLPPTRLEDAVNDLRGLLDAVSRPRRARLDHGAEHGQGALPQLRLCLPEEGQQLCLFGAPARRIGVQ